MEGEFWITLQQEVWLFIVDAGRIGLAWAASDSGRATLLGIAAGLAAGWIMARSFYRRVGREMDVLVKRLEAGTAYLESSLDRLQSEIMVANRNLEKQVRQQAENTPRPAPTRKLPGPLGDLGNDWARVDSAAGDADGPEKS